MMGQKLIMTWKLKILFILKINYGNINQSKNRKVLK